jgi:DNA ligase (NAD+)
MENLRKTYLAKVETLRKAALAYYIDGADTGLTDEEYDLLLLSVTSMGEGYNWDEHVKLAEEVAGGSTLNDDADKVKHRSRMLSLAKAQDAETLEKFLQKMKDEKASVLLEPKLDGLAIVAIYRDGKLAQVATRGDSRQGQNVTARALQANIKGLPNTIDYKGELEIRGELFMTADDFVTAQAVRDRNSIRENCNSTEEGHTAKNCASHTRKYKHARSAVSGMILSKDEKRIDGVTLTFGTYDVIPFSGSALGETSYTALLNTATALGFVTTASLIEGMFAANESIHDRVVKFGKVKKTIEFPTDGIVVKIDSLPLRDKIGNSERSPRWAIAYKYEAEIKETVLRDIVRNVGRTGAISYVADFDMVVLDGSEVSAATLNNSRFIEALDLRLGDTIMVRKANDIIPEIVSVVFAERKGQDRTAYVAPKTCPKCSEELDTVSSIIWRCENPECSVANRILHAVSRDNLDMDGISSKLIEKLLEADLINDVTDLYKLTVKQIASLETGRFYAADNKENKAGDPILVGELMAKKHVKNIQVTKERELNRIVSSLGVRHLGRTFSAAYAKHFKSFDKIVNATVAELQGIDKVKDKAVAIRAGFDAIQPLLEKYRAVGFSNMDKVEEKVLGSALKGENVVVTGTVPGYGRNEVKDLIEAHGGVAGGSVSGKTTLVVAPEDERDSTKAKKALSLGITLITPEKFLDKLV